MAQQSTTTMPLDWLVLGGALLSGLLDANCDKAEEYREESDGWRT